MQKNSVVTQLQDLAMADMIAATVVSNAGLSTEQGDFIRSERSKGRTYLQIVFAFNEKFHRMIDERTVSRYVNDPTHTGERSGRPEILDKVMEDRVINVFNVLRGRGFPVTLKTITQITTGLVKRHLPKLDGVHSFGKNWARGFAKRHHLAYRKATTSRIVSTAFLVKEGNQFYDDIKKYADECIVKPDPRLTFNVDEFFVLNLLCDGTSTWTRTKNEHGTISIPIKESKLGFTASILTSAAGTAKRHESLLKRQGQGLRNPT